MNKAKSLFFEKDDKIYKLLPRLSVKKEERTQITHTELKEDITTDPTDMGTDGEAFRNLWIFR